MLQIKVVTPEKVILDQQQVEWILVPTDTGIIAVYPEHMDLYSKLIPGELIVKTAAETHEIVVTDGVIQVSQGTLVSVLVEVAEHIAEIDLEKAEAAKQKAEEYLETYDKDIDAEQFARVQATLIREMAKIAAVRKRKNL
ncbi:MAG: ATP synthase F1 subunit epsilon [Candidatus Dojkabacteria bacterium]|nr:MAG: ATP synthase F1 subunit epsilon [Candidatus Dojkabacteria bacterium]